MSTLTNYYNLNKYNRSSHRYVDGDFTVATPTSMERPIWPFEGNTQDFLLEQDFIQYIDYYMDTVPTPGTPNEKYPDLYFCFDTPIRDIGGGVGTWTRTWGILPGFNAASVSGSYVRREGGSYVWNKPGVKTTAVDDGQYVQWFVDNDASSYSGDNVTLVTKTNPSTGLRWDHDLSSYNTAYIIYDVWIRNQPFKYAYQPAIISQTTSSITVERVPFNDAADNPILYYSFSKPLIAINSSQRVINTFTYFDYWVPGINCDTEEDIPLVQEWHVLDANGNQVDFLSDDTDPTRTEYAAMVAAGTKVCVESSVVRRWRGNIFERATRYGKVV